MNQSSHDNKALFYIGAFVILIIASVVLTTSPPSPPPERLSSAISITDPPEVIKPSDPVKTAPSPRKETQRGLGARLKTLSPPLERATAWTGSKSFSLGVHTISLRGGEWRLRLKPVLSTMSPETYRLFAPYRKRFIQMLYFLVSRRAPEGLRSVGGEERLRSDYNVRLHNVLREHVFSLDFESLTIVSPPEDEGEWIIGEEGGERASIAEVESQWAEDSRSSLGASSPEGEGREEQEESP